MTREQLEKRMDEPAREFAETRDAKILAQLDEQCRHLKAYRVKVTKVVDLEPGASKTAMDCIFVMSRWTWTTSDQRAWRA
jgi:hypothetical protein